MQIALNNNLFTHQSIDLISIFKGFLASVLDNYKTKHQTYDLEKRVKAIRNNVRILNDNLEHSYDISYLKEYFIEVYKQREITKKTTEINTLADLKEKERAIQELQELSNISSTVYTLTDSEESLKKYKEYLDKAKESLINNGGVLGISTGIPSLNEKIIGLKNTEYILVAARPSMGKTSSTVGMFLEAIFDTKVEGVPVFFSVEVETEQIMGKMIAQMYDDLEVSTTIFRKNAHQNEELIEQAMEKLSEQKYYIEDFSEGNGKLGVTPQDIDIKLKKIEEKEGKISCIFIDYIQLLHASNSRIIGMNERTSSISSELKALARKYQCPVVALSQLNRDLEKRVDKRPQLSDLRDSGSLEQDADIILFVYRAEVYLEKELLEKLKNNPEDQASLRQLEMLRNRQYSEAEIIVGKNRNGPTGIVQTYFNKKNTRFGDISEEEDINLSEIYGGPDIYEED